jgi:hypothetical protein
MKTTSPHPTRSAARRPGPRRRARPGAPRPRALLAAGLLALGAAATACRPGGPPAPEIVVEDAWARPTRAAPGPHGGATSAAYMTIRNRGDAPDRLLAASAGDLAGATELHRSLIEEGVMRMRPADVVEIAPGEAVRLEPGGLHVMLIDVARELRPGDRFTLSLTFERTGTVEVEVPVREM